MADTLLDVNKEKEKTKWSEIKKNYIKADSCMFLSFQHWWWLLFFLTVPCTA